MHKFGLRFQRKLMGPILHENITLIKMTKTSQLSSKNWCIGSFSLHLQGQVLIILLWWHVVPQMLSIDLEIFHAFHRFSVPSCLNRAWKQSWRGISAKKARNPLVIDSYNSNPSAWALKVHNGPHLAAFVELSWQPPPVSPRVAAGGQARVPANPLDGIWRFDGILSIKLHQAIVQESRQRTIHFPSIDALSFLLKFDQKVLFKLVIHYPIPLHFKEPLMPNRRNVSHNTFMFNSNLKWIQTKPIKWSHDGRSFFF